MVELHVKDGDSPTLRLEQDGSSGFTPQTWDLAGNETNFFIRDVTNGSKLPFRIRPGAPDSAIDIASTGNVGIGTASPAEELTVKSSAANSAVVEVQAAGSDNRVAVISETSGNAGLIGVFNDSDVQSIRINGDNGGRMSIGCSSSPADLTLNATGSGSCGTGVESTINAGDVNFTITSSRSTKENIELIETEGLLEKFGEVGVYTYDYIEGPKNRLGLIAEEFHTVFGRGSDKTLNGQEVQMALWLAVQQLAAQNQQLSEQLAEVHGLLGAE